MVNQGAKQLEELIGRAPDPVADRRALTLMQSADGPEFGQVVAGLHSRSEHRDVRLGALLPGLTLLVSPRLADLLGVRAVNTLAEAETVTWRTLAGATPSSLLALSEIGPRHAEEILSVAVREWASAYLREDGQAERPVDPSRRERSPAPDATATGLSPRDLSRAFEELEQTPGFGALKRRRLDPGTPPTLVVVGAELGVSVQRVSELQATTRRRLARKMRDRNWPIRVAADDVRERLGALARTDELDGVFEAIDPDGAAFPAALLHRRSLLLWLADFRINGEWVLDPDIEGLTRIVFSFVVDSKSADLDVVGRHLSRLGVREEVQLPWIVSQRGFRIIDGELVRQRNG